MGWRARSSVTLSLPDCGGSGAADARATLVRGAAQHEAHLHLLLETADEPVGEGGLVARRPERILPLPWRKAAQQIARPSDVGGRDVTVELLVPPARVVEPDVAVPSDGLDEALLFEVVDVVAAARDGPPLRPAEGPAQIAHHVH